MSKQEQITDFVNRYFTNLPRHHKPLLFGAERYSGWNQNRPKATDLARDLLSCGEFRELQLGTWLGTTDGEIITQAVEMVVPAFYAEDVVLIVEALKLAAAAQQQEGHQKVFASVVIVTLAIIALRYLASPYSSV